MTMINKEIGDIINIIGRNTHCMYDKKKALTANRIAGDVESRGKSSASMETKTPTAASQVCVTEPSSTHPPQFATWNTLMSATFN